MAELFNFSESLVEQTDVTKTFGHNTPDLFRITSSFDISSPTSVYAITTGTILLQQQAANPAKVNLILKPQDSPNMRLPVKYFIYRGLDINDFLVFGTPFDLTHVDTEVKVPGDLEITIKMKEIQEERAPMEDIPVEALFGNDLVPLATKEIDEFFFKNLHDKSQLFTIPGGTEIGKFAAGDGGLEVILENPEYTPDVEMAKKPFLEFDVSTITDPLEKKWTKDLVRHFVDPVALYGLHFDITGGIGYMSGGTMEMAESILEVYSNVMMPFFTRNKVYLDIRNENGYSYNYYNNYQGISGPDMDKELMIGPSGSLLIKEYYTNEWPLHEVQGIVPSSSLEHNEFFIQLRSNQNEKPLLAGSTSQLPDAEGADDEQMVQFIRETELLPDPSEEFTEEVKIKVPNKLDGGSGEQISTIVQLNYFKQIRINDGIDAFPRESGFDHLFGPVNGKLPWDVSANIQWACTDSHSFYDGLSQGFALSNLEIDILAIDTTARTITLDEVVTEEISKHVRIRNILSSPENVGNYTVVDVVVSGGQTIVTVKEAIPTTQNPGDRLKFDVEIFVYIDRVSNLLVARDIDLTSSLGYQVGSKVKMFGIYSSNTITRFTITSSTLIGASTYLEFTPSIRALGFGAIVETGIILETDSNTFPPVERALFYSVPRYYLEDKGVQKTKFFNYKGGTDGNASFFEMLESRSKNFEIEKFNLEITPGEFIATLSYKNNEKIKENLLLLGIGKPELDILNAAADSELSTFHNRMLRLIPIGNRLKDLSYEPYFKFNLVVSGLDSSGLYHETSVFVEVFSRDGLIFTSKDYASTFELNAIELSPEEKFHLNPSGLSHTDLEYGEYDKVMELSDSESTYQHLYEIIGLDLKSIVDSFDSEIGSLTSTNVKAELPEIILSKGQELLDTAKANIRNATSPMFHKDGALYLARLHMSKALKENTVATSTLSLTEFQENLDLLEKVTRGLHATNVPDFSTHSDSIPILITGYDPFRAIYKRYLSFVSGAGMDGDFHLSNSSGNVALALDGEPIVHMGSGNEGILKGSVFPVRFREFNEGWVEDYFEQYINPNHPNYQPVKMIITFSHGLTGEVYDFEIERFAGRHRKPDSVDNNQEKAGINQYLSNSDKDDLEFIETNLPTANLFQLDEVGLDQSAVVTYSKAGVKFLDLFGDPIEVNIDNPFGNDDLKDTYESLVLPITITNYPYTDADSIESLKGSGGNYLSNEIFYRVAFLREKYKSLNPDLKTGHIHLGYMLDDPSTDRETMITDIREAIRRAIEFL